MRSVISVFAREVRQLPNGSLSLVETFNFFEARRFPAEIGLNLVIGLIVDPLEYGTEQQLSVRLLMPDGDELDRLTSEKRCLGSINPGYPVAANAILRFRVPFPEEGLYTFDVCVNGVSVAQTPLYVGAPPAGVSLSYGG